MNDTPQTPPPSGNTQTQILLFGSVASTKGQPVTKPVALSPKGGIQVEMDQSTGYITGTYQVFNGDSVVFAEGRVVAIFRANGDIALPLPGNPGGF